MGTKNKKLNKKDDKYHSIKLIDEETVQHSREISMNIFLWIILSLIFGYFHMIHVENLFENDKHFSHLSNLERELSFRTESGLYYYYFKSLVVDENQNSLNTSLYSLINQIILNDNRTEHPTTINSLQRFNLYPEIALAHIYRLANRLKLLTKSCWTVNRGDGAPPVESCEGYLEPIYFYSKSVFVLHGFLISCLFTLCWLLNERSLLAGVIGCLCYFYNHGESTRVMWTPALRESFSFPFHLLQLVSLAYFIKAKETNKRNEIFLTVTTLVYLLPWQFAQFSLGTQTASIFATYCLGFMEKHKLVSFVRSQTFALLLTFILMFANRMLMTSFFASLLCSIWLIILIEKYVPYLKNQPKVGFLKICILAIVRVLILFSLMILFKKYILSFVLQQEDDSHIWDLLKSKFDPDSHTFDTRLYTCAAEFDFLEFSTIEKIVSTTLLPISVACFTFYLFLILKKFFFLSSIEHSSQDTLILYNMFQLVAYSLMSFLIMRLKLFWTPYLCIFASFLSNADPQYNLIDFLLNMILKIRVLFISSPNKTDDSTKLSKYGIIFLLIAIMSYQGISNLKQQYTIIGEYNNYPQETLMNWISKNTRINDAFAGSMPLMANVKLSTNRPIVNHPHYEDVGLRYRIKQIYSHIYGYRPVKELYDILKKECKANYLVIEKHYCYSNPPGKPQCGLSQVSHINFNKTTDHQACDLIIQQKDNSNKHFLKVFEYSYIFVFKIV